MSSQVGQNIIERLVHIDTGEVILEGALAVPPGAKGVVLFAHGSGSSRKSSRNQLVSNALREGGLGTLLFDLLTTDEEKIDLRTRSLRFDIELLAARVIGATDWFLKQPGSRAFNIGYFGSSTGAAAALIASTLRPDVVQAVVSRGGRPDLADPILPHVRAATLLIVGGYDYPVIEMNEEALAQLGSVKKLELIPDATHLFQEPGALEQVADLARDWFQQYL